MKTCKIFEILFSKICVADDRKVGAIFPKYRVAVRQAAEKQSSDVTSLKTLAGSASTDCECNNLIFS